MIKLERPLVGFDLECTGINKEEDRIVEFALIKVNPDYSRETKAYRVNPGIPIPEEATAVHGITDEMVKDCPTFKQYAFKILQFLEGCDIASFNGNAFDLPFIFNEFYRAGIVWDYTKHHSVDAGNIFKIKNPRTLTAAYKQYCNGDHTDAHGAEADVKVTLQVLFAQIEQHGADEDFPTSIPELALFSNYGNKIADLSGKFVYDKDGELLINFTQDKKGQKAKDHESFISWMLYKANFPPDTQKFCRMILDNDPENSLDEDFN